MPSKFRRELKSWSLCLLAVFVFRASVAESFEVPTGSMQPTILPGDRLLVSKLAYDLHFPFTSFSLWRISEPQRGDVVVFRYPVDRKIDFVKRLIGLPGDHLVVHDGWITVNGVALTPKLLEMPMSKAQIAKLQTDLRDDERSPERARQFYLEPSTPHLGAHLVERIESDFKRESPPLEFDVPPGHYFFMGDNRDDSHDSRAWGFVAREDLKGKAQWIEWSKPVKTRIASLSDVAHFLRWERSGKAL